MNDDATDDGDILAAEYVIGTLDGAERSAFAARLLHDDAARRSVASWERRLAPLRHAVESEAPPVELWSRIERALGEAPQSGPVLLPGGRTAGDFGALDIVRRSRDRWRRGAAALASLAAILLVFVAVHDVARIGRGGPDPIFVAAVNRGGDKPALIVRVDMRTRQVLIRPVAAQQPSGHSLELWYIGVGGRPRSLGLVTDAAARRSIPIDASSVDAATFAVSVEPPGGSPTGGPTGAVLYSGQLVRE